MNTRQIVDLLITGFMVVEISRITGWDPLYIAGGMLAAREKAEAEIDWTARWRH